MLLISNATATITRQTDNGRFVTVLNQVVANVQTDRIGQQIASPWARPGTDEAGGLLLSNKFIFLGGDDANPGYQPVPGDVIEIMDCPGLNGIYRQVADTGGGSFRGLNYWKLPTVRVKYT